MQPTLKENNMELNLSLFLTLTFVYLFVEA